MKYYSPPPPRAVVGCGFAVLFSIFRPISNKHPALQWCILVHDSIEIWGSVGEGREGQEEYSCHARS